MKHVVLSLMFALVSGPALAGGISCDVLEDGQIVSNVFMDWEPTGTVLKFDRPVGFYDDASTFEVIYSTHLADKTQIISAVSPGKESRQDQMLEITGARGISDLNHATLKVGDRNQTLKYLAKNKEYRLSCN